MTLLRFIHVKYCYIASPMTEKMLKFVDINQKNPSKRNEIERKMILMKYMQNLYMKMPINNLADVLNVEFHFAKFIVL